MPTVLDPFDLPTNGETNEEAKTMVELEDLGLWLLIYFLLYIHVRYLLH